MRSKIDINVDLGEGFGNETSIMPFISSANIACGGHAGDKNAMQLCVDLAIKNNVRIGAHPGFEDKENFGRKILNHPLDQIKNSISVQVNKLLSICNSKGIVLSYIKPHGALYHLVCNKPEYAIMMINLVKDQFLNTAIMGLPNSLLEKLALKHNVNFIKEGFADRVYEINGNLRDRNKPNSVWNNYEQVLKQVIALNEGVVLPVDGPINLNVDSICFHGDHPGSAEIIQKINKDLINKGFEISV